MCFCLKFKCAVFKKNSAQIRQTRGWKHLMTDPSLTKLQTRVGIFGFKPFGDATLINVASRDVRQHLQFLPQWSFCPFLKGLSLNFFSVRGLASLRTRSNFLNSSLKHLGVKLGELCNLITETKRRFMKSVAMIRGNLRYSFGQLIKR